MTVENSPLAEWQLFNAIDFLYSADLGEGEAKQATNTLMNGRSVFRRESGPHYRMFVCAFRDEADAAVTGSSRRLRPLSAHRSRPWNSRFTSPTCCLGSSWNCAVLAVLSRASSAAKTHTSTASRMK